jgi:ParB/RepB/Spo0J family partition protein
VFVNGKQQFELIAGERRLRAARLADVGLVPIEVIEGSADDIHEMSIIDNLQREDLKPLEEGEAYQRMFRELNISEAELARRLGKSRGHIQQRRALAAAAPVVREAIENGEINLTLARNIAMGTDNPKLQKKALTALKKRLNTGARTEEKHVREIVQDVVRKDAGDTLKKLGWNVLDGYIWGGNEKPRHWEAAEMTQAAKEQRRPEGEPPAPGELTPEQEYMIQVRYFDYYKDEKFQPWLVFTDRESYRPEFFSHAEIPDLILDIGREFASLQKLFKSYGYELKINNHGSLIVSHPKGAERNCLSLKGVRDFLEQVEAGKVNPEQRSHGYQWICQHCLKKFHSLSDESNLWLSRDHVCRTCYDVAMQRIASLREEIKQEHGMLIVRMNTDLLRRLLDRFHGSGATGAIWKVKSKGTEAREAAIQRLQQADEELLREVLLDCLAEDEYERQRVTPDAAQQFAESALGVE